MACDTIIDWYQDAIERQQAAFEAQEAAIANLEMATAYFVAADVAATACFALVYTPPPFSVVAFGICEATALAAMAAAYYSMSVYLEDVEKAGQAYEEIGNSIEILEEMLCKCEATLGHLDEADTEAAQVAYAAALAADIPEVDSDALEEAEEAVEEAEEDLEEAEEYVEDHEDEEWPVS